MRQCQAFLLVCPSLEHITQTTQSLSQHLSEQQAHKLASPNFWTFAGKSETETDTETDAYGTEP
jgi:hypothetical protein